MVVKIPAVTKPAKKIMMYGLHHPLLGVLILFSKKVHMVAPSISRRSLLVDLLIVLFGVSSWVAVNGLWVELPVLVKRLPEQWKLASYIVVTTQVANLGPLIFGAARKKWSQKVLEVSIIHASLAVVVIACILLSIFWDNTTYIFDELHSTALLVLTFFMFCVECTSSLLYLPFIANFKEQYVILYMIGAGLNGPIPSMLALDQEVLEVPIIHASLAVVVIACVLLSIFWDSTTYIFDELHSTALLVLTFFMSCVDCTSSLLYLPFIANFKEQYVISYMIGAGLSGPIPSMLALAQGVGGYVECINKTVINITEYGNETYNKLEPYYSPPRFSVNVFFVALALQMVVSWIAFILLNKLPQAKRERVSIIPVARPSNPAFEENFQSSVERDMSSSVGSSVEKSTSSEQNLLGKPYLSRSQFLVLLFIQGFINMLYNGILLALQTYSCLPYGSLPYHLAVTLSSFANPLCCFIAVFLPVTSVSKVVGFTVFCAGWGCYILALAFSSPNPPFVNTVLGSILVVLSWVTVSGTVAFIKACIASILRRDGGQVALFKCGVVTQIGSAAGAVISFSLVQFTTLLKSYSPCS